MSIQAHPPDPTASPTITAVTSQAVHRLINHVVSLMHSLSTRRTVSLIVAAAACAWASAARAQADTAGGWELNFSPLTVHFHPSSEHEPVMAVGLTRGLEDGWMVGGVGFTNSFGQPSAYVFGGQRYVEPFGWKKWYLQWTAGVLYGYVGQYKDKVPFNHNGFSPGFVPSIGYKFNDSVYGELDLLGNSALMFNVIIPLSNTWYK